MKSKQLGFAEPFFIALCFITLGLAYIIENAHRAMFQRHDYTGVVLSVGSRLNWSSDGNGGSNGTTKYSLTMLTADGKKAMNCDDTRCASVEKGNKVTLNCWEQVHLFSSNELECRFTEAL